MLEHLVMIVVLTFVPGLELRASIPYGIVTLGVTYWPVVFLIAVLANIAVGILSYVFVRYLLSYVRRVPWIERLYQRVIIRTERKMERHFRHFETYEVLGLAFFIGIPLPGSGVYTGSLIASLLRVRFRSYLVASICGVLIAGIAVTLVMITGTSAFDVFLKRV